MTSPAALASAVSSRPSIGFSQRPMLVFWETTRACPLACRHCRASATTHAPPGELSTAEGCALIDQVAGFGRPYPILVLTGGDCLLRPDLFGLVEHAVSRGIPVCLSPSVTPLLDAAMIGRIARSGVRAVSVSLDGCRAQTHDGVRGIAGNFEMTITAIAQLVGAGITVQVNTTVMDGNVDDLPGVAAFLAQAGAHIWEVFFLVQVGRGTAAGPISPAGHEDVCHFLYDASGYGFIIRTVSASAEPLAASPAAGGRAPVRAEPIPDIRDYRGRRQPGPVEQAVRELGAADQVLILRAAAIDKAARALIAAAKSSAGQRGAPRRTAEDTRHHSAARVAAESFPREPVAPAGSRSHDDYPKRAGEQVAGQPVAHGAGQPARADRDPRRRR